MIDIRQLINTCLKIMNEGVNETTTMETVTIINLSFLSRVVSSAHMLRTCSFTAAMRLTKVNNTEKLLSSKHHAGMGSIHRMIHIVLIAASFSALKCNLQCRKFRSKFIIVTIPPKAKHVP